MSVLLSDLKLYAAAVTPEDDSVTGIGGAIDLTKKFDFSDFSGASQVVSSNPNDTTQHVTLTYRTPAGAITTLAINLNGTAVVTNATSIGRVLKAVKSATCQGDVALESQAAELTGTLVSVGDAPDHVVLPGGASGIDGHYNGMVFRATGGTGAGEIAEVIDYVGATKKATLSKTADTAGGPYGDPYANFDGTTTFRIARGVFFDRTPSEILYVVRMDYNAAANAPGGPEIDFFIKGYFKHTDASGSGLSMTECQVVKAAGNARVTFTLDSALNGSGTNGGGNNRQVSPSSGVGAFGSVSIATPSGGIFAPGDTLGIWMRLVCPGGALTLNETWTPSFQGKTA